MGAVCGTPIRGPWVGLETCEPLLGGTVSAAREESADEAVRCSCGRPDTGPGRARAAPARRGGPGRARAAPARRAPGGDGRSVDTESMF